MKILSIMPQMAQSSVISPNRQHSPMGAMKSNDNHKQVNFEGIGTVETTYYKLSEEFSKSLLSELSSAVHEAFKAIKDSHGSKLKINQQSIKSDRMREIFQNLGLANEEGVLIGFKPKKVVINYGADIIPDDFVASEILQAGGHIEGKLTGDKVAVTSGRNHGVEAKGVFTQSGIETRIEGEVHAGSLDADNTNLAMKVTVDGNEAQSFVHLKNAIIPEGGELNVNNCWIVTSGSTKFMPRSITTVNMKRPSHYGAVIRTEGNTEFLPFSILKVNGKKSDAISATCATRFYQGSQVTSPGVFWLKDTATFAGEFNTNCEKGKSTFCMFDSSRLLQGSGVNTHDFFMRNKATASVHLDTDKLTKIESAKFNPDSEVVVKGESCNVEDLC